MITPIVNMTPESLTKMRNAATMFQRYPAEFQKAFKATGLMGLGIVQKAYDQKSMGKEGNWQPLSEVTVLLRRKGSGKKIKDQADLNAKKAQPLKDTGLARRSLSFGASDNVLRPTNMKVSFGSRIKYLLPHVTGFLSVFRFDKEKQERFFKNVNHLEPSRARKWINLEKGIRFAKNELALLPKSGRAKKTKFDSFRREVDKQIRKSAKGFKGLLGRKIRRKFGLRMTRTRDEIKKSAEVRVAKRMLKEGRDDLLKATGKSDLLKYKAWASQEIKNRNKVWTRWAWSKWHMLEKMDGKQYKVPARPIWGFNEATPEQLARLARPLIATMQRLFKRGR